MRRYALLIAVLPVTMARAQEPDQGEVLYQNQCTECHESVLHVRERTRVASLAELEAAVRRWSESRQPGWTDSERDSVRDYLNRSFYGFFETSPPPPPEGATN